MKDLLRFSSIFIIITFAYSSETKSLSSLESKIESRSESITKTPPSFEVAPIDVEKMKDYRLKKAIKDKKYVNGIINGKLNSDQNKKSLATKNSKNKNFIQRIVTEVRSKLSVMTLKSDKPNVVEFHAVPDKNLEEVK